MIDLFKTYIHHRCDEHLQHLNLTGNPLSQGDLSGGGSGLGALAKMLKQNACLTCVELAGVGLTDKDASAFLSALKRDNTTLMRLEVGGNAPFGLSWSKERDLAEACEANMELAQVASNPSRYMQSEEKERQNMASSQFS